MLVYESIYTSSRASGLVDGLVADACHIWRLSQDMAHFCLIVLLLGCDEQEAKTLCYKKPKHFATRDFSRVDYNIFAITVNITTEITRNNIITSSAYTAIRFRNTANSVDIDILLCDNIFSLSLCGLLSIFPPAY